MVHKAEIELCGELGSQTAQISHHIIGRLQNGGLTQGCVSKHDQPRFCALVSVEDPIVVLLVVEHLDAHFAPSLVDPVVKAHPILLQIYAQSELISCFTVLLDELLGLALVVFAFLAV